MIEQGVYGEASEDDTPARVVGHGVCSVFSQVDMVVRERMIRVAGTMCELPPRWDGPIRRLAGEIVSNLGEAWGAGNTLDRILLAGGGSAESLIADAIQQKYPHAVVVEDPQYAIARGCARRARLLVQEMRVERVA